MFSDNVSDLLNPTYIDGGICMNEKRNFKRRPITIDVNCDMSADQKGFDPSTKDISVGGICLISKKAFPIGKIIEFKFAIPDFDKTIEVSGRIVWNEIVKNEKEEIFYNGIQFVRIESEDRDLIGKYVDGATFERKSH